MLDLKRNKHDPILVTRQVQHLLLSSIYCQYSENIVVGSTVTVKLPLFSCLQALLLTSHDGLLFMQTEACN